MDKTRFGIVFIFVLFLTPIAKAQNTTVWGPGENYEIDYLHSGIAKINESTIEEFNKKPVTQFTLKNITNSGYDYEYIGYGEIKLYNNVRMNTLPLSGFGSFSFPSGALPIALPLSYNGQDEWITHFANQIKDLQSNDISQFNIPLINANISISDNKVDFKFNFTFTGSYDELTTFYSFPEIQNDQLNGEYYNGSVYSKISYTKSTGVVDYFELEITSLDYIRDGNVSLGKAHTNQVLEFVAIIPPNSFMDQLRFDDLALLITISLLIIPILNRVKFRI